jgi:hypothetical protein
MGWKPRRYWLPEHFYSGISVNEATEMAQFELLSMPFVQRNG